MVRLLQRILESIEKIEQKVIEVEKKSGKLLSKPLEVKERIMEGSRRIDKGLIIRIGVAAFAVLSFSYLVLWKMNGIVDNRLSDFDKKMCKEKMAESGIILGENILADDSEKEKENIILEKASSQGLILLKENEGNENLVAVLCETQNFAAESLENVENPVKQEKQPQVVENAIDEVPAAENPKEETPAVYEPIKIESEIGVMTESDKAEDMKAVEKKPAYTFKSGENNTKWLANVNTNSYKKANLKTKGGYKYYYEDGQVVSNVGIDVSAHQGTINWKKVKDAGVEFAMIRVGFRGYGKGKLVIDSYYKKNIEGALANGINVGVYFFSSAITVKEAIEEAELTLQCIRDYNITYPVAFDTEFVPDETARMNTCSMTNKLRTDMCIAFCERVRIAGYTPMVYACKSWLTDALQLSRLNSYDIWYARYNDTPDYPYSYTIWQFSESGSVPGINTKVDMNVGFKNYTAIKLAEEQRKLEEERRAQEERLARERAEIEARHKAEELARQQAEEKRQREEAARIAEEERKAEEERIAREKAEELRKQQEEAERLAKEKQEEEARLKAEAEEKAKEEKQQENSQQEATEQVEQIEDMAVSLAGEADVVIQQE
ncbi:MAG: hypothetical protein K6G26_02515 [Lachnospiraceae bacterium]|nr:hypothetical protein [Lachnospiraceae bacterium]